MESGEDDERKSVREEAEPNNEQDDDDEDKDEGKEEKKEENSFGKMRCEVMRETMSERRRNKSPCKP